MVKLEEKYDLCDLVIEDTEMKFRHTLGSVMSTGKRGTFVYTHVDY